MHPIFFDSRTPRKQRRRLRFHTLPFLIYLTVFFTTAPVLRAEGKFEQDIQSRTKLERSHGLNSDGATTLPLKVPDPSKQNKTVLARVYPPPELEPVELKINSRGEIFLPAIPRFTSKLGGKSVGIAGNNRYVFYSINPSLQEFADNLLDRASAPHAALVVMDPKTGRVFAMTEKSKTLKDASTHAGFPAASLFKVVTTSAALERSRLGPYSPIKFRGGNYTLNKWNYRPDPKRDTRVMSLAEALGKSCNAVFARVALQHLTPTDLRAYAKAFGFNSDLEFDSPLHESSSYIPSGQYELGRTAAGFGAVHLSPVHAATMMSAIANHGTMPRPSFVDKVVDEGGEVVYQSRPELLHRVVQPDTAKTLLRMMQFTTTVGTSRKEFSGNKHRSPVLPREVAAKTGTLRGSNPKGLNRWFIAAAPADNPQVAIAVIVVNPGNGNASPSHIGRELLEKYFEGV